MKILHTADWHIGKKLAGYDLLADQKAMLAEILKIAKSEKVDAIIVAGDVYDRQLPDQQSVALVNETMQQWNLVEGFPLLVIAGNHDSAIRLATGNPWYQKTQFHLHTTISQAMQPIHLADCQFYLLPYVEPYQIKQFFQEIGPDHPLANNVPNLEAGLQGLIALMQTTFDPTKKQILVSHFFVAGSIRQESETPLEVGGLAGVSMDIFAPFDYVALGHLHSAKAINKGNIRYSGAPLKYASSESRDNKGVWLIDTDALSFMPNTEDVLPTLSKAALRFVPIKPLHEVYEITTSFMDLLHPSIELTALKDEYLAITLTDHEPILNLMAQLRSQYPRILSVTRQNLPNFTPTDKLSYQDLAEGLKPVDLVASFYESLTNEKLNLQQIKWLKSGLQAIQSTENQEEKGD